MAASTHQPVPTPDRLTLISFAIFILVSGGASVAIRFTFAELQPFWGAAARFLIGAAIFWVIVFIQKIPIPKGRALLGSALYGALAVGLAFILIYWGLTKTPASLYQILTALVPLLTLFLARMHGLETIRVRGVIGSLLALAGIIVVVGGASADTVSLPHIIAIIGGAVCFAEAGVVVKIFPRNDPMITNAVGMTVGAIMLLVASFVSGETWIIPSMLTTWIAFGYIVIFVTFVAFFLYVFILGRWTASGTAYSFVIIPLITAVLAAALAGEQITIGFIIGSAIVLAGVIIGALLPEKPQSRE